MSPATRPADSSSPSDDPVLEDVLGYLNFSSGTPNATFRGQLNRLCERVDGIGCWDRCRTTLEQALDNLSVSSETYADSRQARAVIELVFEGLWPAYLDHHADLLFHLAPADLEHPFLLARLFEAVLQHRGDQPDAVIPAALDQLNDFLGYRPLAILENEQQCEPYAHERFCPVPLYFREVGVAGGRYGDLVDATFDVLQTVPASLRTAACFDPDRIDELSLDVRAHDHLHPVNKRTTYMFGEWDPHRIDRHGFYRRFVLRQVILDALVDWIDAQEGDRAEATEDAAVVLAGTVLMASAISGAGPDTHDSTVSLTTLLPVVARLRDEFYEHCLSQTDGERAERLLVQARQAQQPFGHVRRELNLYLARYGARQIQHRHLALLFARIGYPDAARQQAGSIPAVSNRFECEIQCEITAAMLDGDHGNLHAAAERLERAERLLWRGIECGGLVDPWNILGFQGQFPLFAAREDAIPDQRVESLLSLIDLLLTGHGRLVSEAAAGGDDDLIRTLSDRFAELADRWDRYATTTVADLPAISGRNAWQSAMAAVGVLVEWRSAGAAAGDIAFWRDRVDVFEDFPSGQGYAEVVETLLDHSDLVAAMGLLMQWLSQAQPDDLAGSPHSIATLLERWLQLACDPSTRLPDGHRRGELVVRLFAFLEANAGEYYSVPALEPAAEGAPPVEEPFRPLAGSADEPASFDDLPDDEDELYQAAYDDMVFRDSADDGHFGEVLDDGLAAGTTEFEWLARRLEPRLMFLDSLGRLWQQASTATAAGDLVLDRDSVREWAGHARGIQINLRRLIDETWHREVPGPGDDADSAILFDIELQTKFELIQGVMIAHVSCRRAEMLLRGQLERSDDPFDDDGDRDARLLINTLRAVVARDIGGVRRRLPRLLKRFAARPLLYAPLDDGGEPRGMLTARTLHSDLAFLLEHLPRLGLLRETWQVLRTAYRMERVSRPEGASVTEFDRLFRIALRHSLEALVSASGRWQCRRRRPRASDRRPTWRRPPGATRPLPRRRRQHPSRPRTRRAGQGRDRDRQLIELVGRLVKEYQAHWLRHSSRTRLSAAEGLDSDETWDEVKAFVERYGDDLFAAPNLTLGHIRAILHQGAGWFLDQLAENTDPLGSSRLLDEIAAGSLDRVDVERILELVYGVIVDRYYRFIEYNTTTTQSDYGEKLYCLLDFLRLEASYERDAWNFAPSEIAHDVLSRCRRPWLAQAWEIACAAGTRVRADEHCARLESLEELWGMRLPSLADRLNERFLRPLAVNRMRALVSTAVADTRGGQGPTLAFDQLVVEAEQYLAQTHGSGIDVPAWLQRLEQEVVRWTIELPSRRPPPGPAITARQLARLLDTWNRPPWGRAGKK